MTRPGHAIDIADAYEQKGLATWWELGISRSQRLGLVSTEDRRCFLILVKNLQAALDGDAGISASNLTASSEESIDVLQKTLTAMAENTPAGAQIRAILNDLKETAASLAVAGLS